MINRTDVNLLGLRDIPIFNDLFSMSMATGFSKQMLYYYAVKEDAVKYTVLEISKKNNTKRKIYIPRFALKMLQRWVLENILYKIKCSEFTYSFIKEKGSPLKRNAAVHVKKTFILKMDFENFFPSIKRKRIIYLFNAIGYNIPVSNWLANICTYENVLPQGSVTAPYLSNLICLNLDNRIAKYCYRRDLTYSRYADDLTFSGDNKIVLKSIYGMIEKIAESEAFVINKDKTRFIGKKSKHDVTGVLIHDNQLKAPKEYKRLVRSMIHRAIVSGDYSNNEIIKGYIAYINSIEDDYLTKIKSYINSFRNKNVDFIRSTVDAFNNNKIYKDIIDLYEKVPVHFYSEEEEDYFADMVSERYDFLMERKLKIPEELKQF